MCIYVHVLQIVTQTHSIFAHTHTHEPQQPRNRAHLTFNIQIFMFYYLIFNNAGVRGVAGGLGSMGVVGVGGGGLGAGKQFTCYSSTKVQILTLWVQAAGA